MPEKISNNENFASPVNLNTAKGILFSFFAFLIDAIVSFSALLKSSFFSFPSHEKSKIVPILYFHRLCYIILLYIMLHYIIIHYVT